MFKAGLGAAPFRRRVRSLRLVHAQPSFCERILGSPGGQVAAVLDRCVVRASEDKRCVLRRRGDACRGGMRRTYCGGTDRAYLERLCCPSSGVSVRWPSEVVAGDGRWHRVPMCDASPLGAMHALNS